MTELVNLRTVGAVRYNSYAHTCYSTVYSTVRTVVHWSDPRPSYNRWRNPKQILNFTGRGKGCFKIGKYVMPFDLLNLVYDKHIQSVLAIDSVIDNSSGNHD